MRIPPIIHQIWFQGVDEVPSKYEQLRASWRRHNPHWTIYTWDATTLMQHMQQHYPDDTIMLTQYEYLIQKCDVARCFLLHHFGGVYVDMDYECLRPLQSFLQHKTFVIGRMDARLINNAFVASAPHHPIWDAILGELRQRFRRRHSIRRQSFGLMSLYGMRTTGPHIFTKVLRNNNRSDVYLAPQKMLYPKPWIGNMRPRDAASHTAESVAMHHWHHSWVHKPLDRAILKAVAVWPDFRLTPRARG